jgi:hypothetical protein
MPQLQIQLHIDANGTVASSARDLGTGTESFMTVTTRISPDGVPEGPLPVLPQPPSSATSTAPSEVGR